MSGADAATPRQACHRCGGQHEILACPYVKAAEFDGDGKITRLEYLTPADYGPQRREAEKPPEGEPYERLGKRNAD